MVRWVCILWLNRQRSTVIWPFQEGSESCSVLQTIRDWREMSFQKIILLPSAQGHRCISPKHRIGSDEVYLWITNILLRRVTTSISLLLLTLGNQEKYSPVRFPLGGNKIISQSFLIVAYMWKSKQSPQCAGHGTPRSFVSRKHTAACRADCGFRCHSCNSPLSKLDHIIMLSRATSGYECVTRRRTGCVTYARAT